MEPASSHSNGILAQSNSFGAQFKSPESNKSESPYSGWQSKSVMGREEGLLGATGGSEDSSSARSLQLPRMGLLGGGDSSMQPAWGNSQGYASSSTNSENMLTDGEMSCNGIRGATGGSESKSSFHADHSIPPPRMGLLGGGEGSGWVNNSGSSAAGWTSGIRSAGPDLPGCGSTSGKPPGSWAQAAGKGLNPPVSSAGPTLQENPKAIEMTAKDHPDSEGKDIRLKAAFSEGWGMNSVNQESPWEVPSSPTPESSKENQPSAVWRAPVNNGTEIWENTLRMNKGAGISVPPPTTTAPPPPWGHTPATNIGGHWGDDDASSVWSGVPANPPSWTEPNTVFAGEKHWGGSQSSWGDGACGSDNGSWAASNRGRSISNWSPIATPKKEVASSGWEPPSPPPSRRPPAAGGHYDDGTAVWGNPQRQGPGMIRLPSAGKTEVNPTWNKPPPTTGRSAAWQEVPSHRDSPVTPSWNDDNHLHSQMKGIQGGSSHYMVGNWNDQQSGPNWGIKPKSSCNWADGQVDTSSWLGPAKQGGKPLCKDIIHASKQFRILSELGFRKEDVENALRNNNMNLEEAAAELQALSNGMMETDVFPGRKVRPATLYDDVSASENSLDSNFLNFKQAKGSSTILNAAQQPSPALIQKLIQQQQQQQQSLPLFNANNNNVQAFGNMKFPSNAHLRHLVQQIQMAVQAGHLNAQILNQPLAPQTLQLLYQLLQQIKVLTQLQQQQLLQSAQLTKQGIPSSNMQLNVQVAQTKQRINNLQNQICANQAIYLKQVPAQQNHHTSSEIFKTNADSLPLVQNELRDLTLHQNQSRLTQWKLSSSEKDENQPVDTPDFSRAPGPLNPKAGSLHPLLDSNESSWSGRVHGDSSWPPEAAVSSSESTNGSNALTSSGVSQPSDSTASYTLTDLVPEFEPGKPWKGNQLKSIEDDPHITPGSITRSPLSVNNIKESNLFWGGKAPEASLSSSTWGYNPASNGSNTSKAGSTKAGWSSDFVPSSEVWPSSKSRSSAGSQSWDRHQSSTFLILRNLTPQIDGSTLKTLCMQHGPLQMFHLFQNGGVALVRYSSREEASKAQSALNNCVLGNTTMLADIPSDLEIQQYLQVSSGQAASGQSSFFGGWGSGSGGSQLWPFSNSSLWGASQPGSDHDSSTNPINSYLPGDLLGGEPI